MADQIKTVADMFRAIEDEITKVKAGELPLDTARVVQRGRGPSKELNLLTGREETGDDDDCRYR